MWPSKYTLHRLTAAGDRSSAGYRVLLTAALVASTVGSVHAHADELSRALKREGETGLRFPDTPVHRACTGARAARIPLRLRRGICYELIVVTADVEPVDVVLSDTKGKELARARGARRVLVSYCTAVDVRATATVGPASRTTAFALQLFATDFVPLRAP